MTKEVFTEISELWAKSKSIVDTVESLHESDMRKLFDQIILQVGKNLGEITLKEHPTKSGTQLWTYGGDEIPHAYIRPRSLYVPEIVLEKSVTFLVQQKHLSHDTQVKISELQYKPELREFCIDAKSDNDLFHVEVPLAGESPIEEAAHKIALVLKAIHNITTQQS